jgi:transcriptional regulator with XRE-family HTH domain
VCSASDLSVHLKNVPRKPQQLKILGDAIRQHRRQAALSQEKLAEKADLHPVYIGKIERGEQWISLNALLRVAKAILWPLRNGLNRPRLVYDHF